MDINRINDRKLALTRQCQLISANKLENVVVSTRNMDDMVHSRAMLEVAIAEFLVALEAVSQPLPATEPEAKSEIMLRQGMHQLAVRGLQEALMASLGARSGNISQRS